MKHIMVMLAVNDSRNGMFVGRVRAVEFVSGNRNTLLSLDSFYLNSETSPVYPICDYNEETKQLRVGRRWFPIKGYRTWAGNWCWDAAYLSPEIAARLFNYLCWNYHSKFSPEVGEERFWNIWKTREFVTARDFDEEESRAETQRREVERERL